MMYLAAIFFLGAVSWKILQLPTLHRMDHAVHHESWVLQQDPEPVSGEEESEDAVSAGDSASHEVAAKEVGG